MLLVNFEKPVKRRQLDRASGWPDAFACMDGEAGEEQGHPPEALVRAACAGDRQAFGQLFRQLYPRVRRTVWGMMGSETEADEVAQETFIKAWDKRDRFNFQSQYSTWVHRIAVNSALDALRRRRRQRGRFLSLFTGNDPHHDSQRTESPQSQTSPLSHPDARAQSRELGCLIETAVNGLPEDQRTVLVLREYEDYSYGEIAETLGIKPGTVMSRLHAARQKLQTILSQELS